jgi:hypothetical protein
MNSYPNMSYCVFQNTELAVNQCSTWFDDNEVLSRCELKAAVGLTNAMVDFIAEIAETCGMSAEEFIEEALRNPQSIQQCWNVLNKGKRDYVEAMGDAE